MKKRIISLLLALLLCSAFALAFAESVGIDLKAMTADELITLKKAIEAELAKRIGSSLSPNRIGRGTYVVGKDIKAGYYDFICLDTLKVIEDGGYDRVTNRIRISRDKLTIYDDSIPIGGHMVFNLEEGERLEISGCSGELNSIEKPSWAP